MTCTGVGLHSGKNVKMTVKPAAPESGIVFRRTDLGTEDRAITDIPARFDLVAETTLCTMLANPAGTRIGTVEHLMAALAGLEISNLLVEIDADELPIMDGSANPFIVLLECAGLVMQPMPRKVLRILKPVSVEDGNRRVALLPDEAFSIRCGIEFETSVIAQQSYAFFLFHDAFKREISRARTFGFLHQAEILRARGLAQGASLDNAIVIENDRVLNDGGLRYQDEFVRHKVLDAIGDLYLAGGPILGRLEAYAAGHGLHNALLRAVFADATAYDWVESAWGQTTDAAATDAAATDAAAADAAAADAGAYDNPMAVAAQ